MDKILNRDEKILFLISVLVEIINTELYLNFFTLISK